MPIAVTIRNEGAFLRVVYEGEEDLESEIELQAALLEAVEEHGGRRLLHDCRAVSGPRLGTLDSFAAAASYDRRFLPVRTALLDLPEHNRENRFWETAVRNQGFTARVFDEEEKAVAWLLDEDDPG